MANSVFGYQVASPEQQRKTAMALLLFVGFAAIVGMGVLFMISHWEQSGHQQAIARIESFDTKCRYVVRNIGKRVSYYDHTGYVGCAEARAVAKSNNNPLGSVQHRTVALVKFRTQQGRDIHTSVIFTDDKSFKAGQEVEILYRTDKPMEAIEFNSIPLFGKKSIAQSEGHEPSEYEAPQIQTGDVESSATVKNIRPGPSASESSSANFWIGLTFLLLMLAAALWILRFIYRIMKRIFFGGDAPRAAAPPIATDRLNAMTARSRQKLFGPGRN